MAPKTEIQNNIHLQDWIATVILQSNRALNEEKDPKFNNERIAELKAILQRIIEITSGDGVILFPAGWVHTGPDLAKIIYHDIEYEIKEILSRITRRIIVCIGIDGAFNPPLAKDPFDSDQMAISVDKTGLIAIARKFFSREDERDYIKRAENYQDGELGKPRGFELNNINYYPFICYDIHGPNDDPQKYPNPGAHVGLNLIHRFYPRGEGLCQENNFPRFWWCKVSYQWRIPIFSTAIFYRRKIPPKWPTGILWDKNEAPGKVCKYDEIALAPHLRELIPLPEGCAEVRIFRELKKNRTISKDFPKELEIKAQIKKAQPPTSKSREVFRNIISEFEKKPLMAQGLKREFNREDQCRYSFPQWHRVNEIPVKYICYEFNDWHYHRKSEITVELLFGSKAFNEIGEIIQAQRNAIAQKLPYSATSIWDTKSTPGWYRLKFIFPDSLEPKIITTSMEILIQETREIINNWLVSKGLDHY